MNFITSCILYRSLLAPLRGTLSKKNVVCNNYWRIRRIFLKFLFSQILKSSLMTTKRTISILVKVQFNYRADIQYQYLKKNKRRGLILSRIIFFFHDCTTTVWGIRHGNTEFFLLAFSFAYACCNTSLTVCLFHCSRLIPHMSEIPLQSFKRVTF